MTVVPWCLHHQMILAENMEASMIFHNQVDQDKIHAANQIMMDHHGMMHLGQVHVLIVMLTSSNAVATTTRAIVVAVIHVGVIEAKERVIGVDLAEEEEVIIIAGEVVLSIKRIEATATRTTATTMTITHLGVYRWSHLLQMMVRVRIGSFE